MKTFLLKLWFNIYKYVYFIDSIDKNFRIYLENVNRLSLDERIFRGHGFINFMNDFFKDVQNLKFKQIINDLTSTKDING